MSVPFTSSLGAGPLLPMLHQRAGAGAVERALQRALLPGEALNSPGIQVPLWSLCDLFEHAARLCGDPLFGLRVGEAMQPEHYGAWVKYVLQARTVGGMIGRAQHALAYHQSGTRMTHSRVGGLAYMEYELPDRIASNASQHALHVLPAVVSAIRRYAGANWRPKHIVSRHATKHLARPLEDALEIPVKRGTSHIGIAFETDILDRQVPGTVPRHHLVTLRDLGEPVSLVPPRTMSEAVRQIMATAIRFGGHEDFLGRKHLETCASTLRLSTRSLKRHLSAEGTTFREIAGHARYAEAQRLLGGTALPLTEIALGLGYSDLAHFTRAFRRWADMAPTEYRRLAPGLSAT